MINDEYRRNMAIVDEIAQIRSRQISNSAFSRSSENPEFTGDVFPQFAAALCLRAGGRTPDTIYSRIGVKLGVDFGPRSDLIHAAARIIAEIDRLDRLSERDTETET